MHLYRCAHKPCPTADCQACGFTSPPKAAKKNKTEALSAAKQRSLKKAWKELKAALAMK